MFILFLITLIFWLFAIAASVALIRTFIVQKSPNNILFITGTVPSRLDGFLKGSVKGLNTDWQGKIFDATLQTGINVFGENREIKSFPFKTYAAKALLDENQVLRIDYNLPQNPFWVRMVQDELVETEKGKYLGKIILNPFPGVFIGVGYFQLSN